MRMFTGAMEPYNRTDLKHKGIGSKEGVDNDGEVLLSPKDTLQACEKMQRSLEEAFSSLIRILIVLSSQSRQAEVVGFLRCLSTEASGRGGQVCAGQSRRQSQDGPKRKH